MFWYPFDIQRCTMNFTLEEISAKFIDLFPGDQFNNQTLEEFDTTSLKYTGEKILDEYYIGDITLISDQTRADVESVMFVKITFGRGLFTIMLTIYVTTFLVNFTGHTAMFYSDVYFETQVSMNVTVMLVQVTMFTSVSSNREYIFHVI